MSTGRLAEAGFSLVEVLIGATIMIAVAAACLGAQLAATKLMNESVARSQLEETAIFGAKEVAYEARWADGAALVLSTENGSSRIDLHTPVNYVAGNPVWSTTITYHVVPSPNDANGNGIHDEGMLVRVQNGKSTVICDALVTGGFTATRTGDSLALQVRLLKLYRGRPLTVVAATSATIRN
ncbi:MAG TPA: hypothetical protein VK348_11470 [Planctomycetota bacterium]|nr:hypothetical protein [Planctomycetota bacterium]